MSLKRKSLGVLVCLLAFATMTAVSAASANQGGGYGPRPQEGGGRGPMPPDEQLKRMTKQFGLTSDQQAKIKPILDDQQKKMRDVRSDTTLDRQTMRRKMMQIRKDTMDQVRAQLDQKQQQKFDKLQQEREERMQNRRGGPMGGPGEPGGDDSGGSPSPAPQNE